MKKSLTLFVTVLLVLSLLLAIPAAAATGATRAPSYCTVTFDGHLTDDSVSTVSVLTGNTLEASDLPVLADRDGKHFAGWSIHYASARSDLFDLAEPIEKDITLYAVWETEIETAELYIRTPSAGEPAGDVQASATGWYADISIDQEAGSYWWDDKSKVADFSATFHGTFAAGKTYYGMIVVRPEHHRFLTAKTTYNIHGAKYYSKSVVDKETNFTRLYFSVTVTAAEKIDEIELALGKIRPGMKMNQAPDRLCLTSGVENERIDVWWENVADVGENYETALYGDSKFESGKTYYTFFQLFSLDDGPQLAAEPKVTLYGGTVADVKTVTSGDYTYLYVIYAVQVPEVYTMCVSVATDPEDDFGGAFYTDIDNYWISLIDGPNVVAGKRTFTAKAHIGYYFDGWYDCLAEGGPVLLTRDPVLVIDHDCFQSIECRFKKGEASDLFICDVPVTDANAGNVLGDGVFRYDAGTKTLTVNGDCTYKGCVIRSAVDGLTVKAAGNSTLHNTDAGGPACALELTADTTITGGKLTVLNDSWNCGIYVLNDAELRIKDAVVEIETDQYAVTGNEADERLVIENSTVHILAKPEKAMAVAFFAADGVKLTGCALVFPEGGKIEKGAILKADETPAHEVLISPKEDTLIDGIRLNVSLPKAGDKYKLPDLAATFDGSYPCTMELAAWYPDSGINPGEIVFEGGKEYFIEVHLRAADGYVLNTETKVYVNGQPVNIWTKLNEEEWCASWWYTVPAGNPFVDVKPDAYYYDAVIWAINHDPQITNGMDPTHFAPDDVCTRGQIVTFLWRAKGCPEPNSQENPFEDVTKNDYFYTAVLWAVQDGITNGTTDKTFSPNDECTRAQVVTLLWRASGCPEPQKTDNPFKDVAESAYYYKAVLWAVENGVTNGTSPDTFSPDDACTRGQIVTFLYRALAG